MDYSLDTCVVVGFTFCPDKHYPPSNKFISNTQKKLYWTTTVKKEYTRKYSKINNIIIKFTNTIIEISRRKDGAFIDSYDIFEKLFLNNTRHIKLDLEKKIRILKYLWNKIGNILDFNKIKSILLNVLGIFEIRKTILDEKLHYHHCTSNVHEKYKNLAKKFVENGGHTPDDIVIIESHDLGLNQEVSIITFDKDFCKACSKTNGLSVECLLC